ncbi:PQQ-binding-like beta-propeller repeat protein [Kitasatospora sp. NPDC048365]|uniref:outer membrane protein assembly factor BamB family protein n=1 Tax=Kitasatospora sp. NPDC048365 TaxID=3364050 RepID=UPI00370F9F7E
MAVPRRRWAEPLSAGVCALALLLGGCASGSGGPPGTSNGGTGTSPGPSELTAGPRGPTPAAPGDWTQYHRDALRTGTVPDLPAAGAPVRTWAARLDGAVYGQPLLVGGRVLAATENNTVYALDPSGGTVLWSRNLGAPARESELPCGNIDPLGITSTPVYDPATGLLFVLAELAGGRHQLTGLDAATGEVVVRRDAEPPVGDRLAHQQRAALALWEGRVVIAYGGLYGDCGDYRGTVLSVPATGAGEIRAYTVPTGREGGIWATGGPVVDGGRLLVSVGNGESTGGGYDGSDSVLSLTPELTRADFFAPATWAEDNAADLDLGSLAPVRVGPYVLAVGKRGTAYLLDAANLGGIGGEKARADICPAFGGAAVDGSTVYLPCENGLVRLTVGADASLHVDWRLPLGRGGSPVVGGGAVWVLDWRAATLDTVDPASGQVLHTVDVGAKVPNFASPVLVGDQVLVGTADGVTAFRTR